MHQPVCRVFISSTAEDLAAHRRVVADTIERLGSAALRMETFGAGPEPPVERCREEVGRAEVLVVVVAHRYGWVPPEAKGGDGERSVTRYEVEWAVERGIPVFAWVVDDAAPWTERREQDDLVDTDRDPAEVKGRVRALKAFKQWLGDGRCVEPFSTPDDLGRKVACALGAWRRERYPELEPPADVQAYLRAVEGETAWIAIRGISSGAGTVRTAGRHPIETLYTPLSAHGGGGELLRDRRALCDLLGVHRLLLEGQPGAGKTTFLRLVACLLARDRLVVPGPGGEAWRVRYLGLDEDAPAPLPVLVRLDALVDLLTAPDAPRHRKPELWLVDLLTVCSAQAEDGITVRHWRRLLDEGEAWLLLDGLDEVAEPAVREQVFRIFEAAARAWPGCPIIVTSRPIDTNPVAALGFRRATPRCGSSCGGGCRRCWSRRTAPGRWRRRRSTGPCWRPRSPTSPTCGGSRPTR